MAACFPTYHWREVLAEEPYVTAIVRGEGEETARRLMAAFQDGEAFATVPGIAWRDTHGPHATRPAPVIADLDAYRVGWELIDHARYSYWGGSIASTASRSSTSPTRTRPPRRRRGGLSWRR